MKLQIRDRDKKALIGLTLAAGLYLGVSQLMFPAYDRIAEGSQAVGDKEEQLRKYRRALASQPRYQALVEQAKKSVSEAEGRLVRGDNAALASVELQTIVEEAARKLSISLGPRNVAPAKRKDDFFNEITMTLSWEGTLNQLTSFLSEIRGASKFVTVRSLQIAPVQPANEAPAKGELKKTVRVNLSISAPLISPSVVPPVAGKG